MKYWSPHHFLENQQHLNAGFLGMSAESWAAIGTFLAVFVALFGETIWKYIRRPILQINFDSQLERCSRWGQHNGDVIQDQELASTGPIVDVKRQYFKLRVVNKGATTARQLRAKVELFDVEKNQLADRFEPSTLSWVTGPDFIDLAPEEDNYINLISQVLERDDIICPLRIEIAYRQARAIAWDRHWKPYKLRVVLHGDNLQKPEVKYFMFTPNAEKGKLGKLEEASSWDK